MAVERIAEIRGTALPVRHAQPLEGRVELGRLGNRPGARRHQPERRALELDAEAGRAGLRRQDNLMVALEHLRA